MQNQKLKSQKEVEEFLSNYRLVNGKKMIIKISWVIGIVFMSITIALPILDIFLK